MQRNKILDYEQVLDKLNEITSKGVITKDEIIGNTEYGLPISQYLIGNGDRNIVITGATHGCEIITTDFILNLMDDITNNYSEWKPYLKDYTIRFIPILNPEGYIISTSAIRKIIPRDMPLDEAEKICKKYYLYYKNDDLSEKDLKKHQEMFKDIDYTCIPDQYSKIRESIKNIFEKYPDLPKGCLQTWSANGNGIDIQANTEYNVNIEKMKQGATIPMKSSRQNNIDTSHPGPINCAFYSDSYDEKSQFKLEKETEAILNLLEHLNKENKLFGYLNYHSTGGVIYQRPAIKPDNLNFSDQTIGKNEIFNFICSMVYANQAVRDKQKKTPYFISPFGDTSNDIENRQVRNSRANSTNDIIRLKHPLDLLIELSAMGGNPIGPYGDINGNYNHTMSTNKAALKQLLKYATILDKISDECKDVFEKIDNSGKTDDEKYSKKMQIMQYVYNEFIKRIEKIELENQTGQKLETNALDDRKMREAEELDNKKKQDSEMNR